MSRFRPHGDGAVHDALSNFALSYAKVMLVFVVVLFALLMPQKKATDGIKPKIEYLITMDWPPGDTDVDIWVETPEGKISYYGNKDAGVANLERDDIGDRSSTYMDHGKQVTLHEPHEENMAIRGKLAGEYIVNVQLYRYKGNSTIDGSIDAPVPVTIHIEKMNPVVEEKFKATVVLTRVKQEIHVVRFHLDENDDLDAYRTDLPVSLVHARRDQLQRMRQSGVSINGATVP